MTTIKEAMDRAARRVKVRAPSSWITATSDAAVDLRDDCLLETIEDLQKRVDWPGPISAQVTITGDGSEDYDLPSDFKRLALGPTAIYEKTTTRRWGVPIHTDGQWTHLKTLGASGAERFFRLRGYDGAWEIDFYPAPASSTQIVVSYMTDKWMATSGGTAGNAWTDETDVLLFDRRPVELGIIWRYRRDKGLDYADTQAEYEAWVQTQANRLRGYQTINGTGGYTPAHPMRVPVPDYIPPS